MIYVSTGPRVRPGPVRGTTGRRFGRRNKYHALPTFYYRGTLHPLCDEPVRKGCAICASRGPATREYWYDSKGEAEYAAKLDEREKNGEIFDWERGKPIVLLDAPKARERITYTPDFWIWPTEHDSYHVDFKSAPRVTRDGKRKGGITETRDFKLKVKLWRQNIASELRVAYSDGSEVVLVDGKEAMHEKVQNTRYA